MSDANDDEYAAKEFDQLAKQVVGLFKPLDEPDRAVLFAELRSHYCFDCGTELPEDGSKCPCSEDDDEDDDDDDDELS